MLKNSRDIARRLKAEGWVLDRIAGSHHIFRKAGSGAIISLPHPKKDLGTGLVRQIYKSAGWRLDEC